MAYPVRSKMCFWHVIFGSTVVWKVGSRKRKDRWGQ